MASTDATVNVAVKPTVVSPKVEAGLSTYMGVILTVLSSVGAIIAALKVNDTATVTAGVSAILIALTTIGGRMAQATAIAKSAALVAQPFVNSIAAVQDHEADAVTPEALPTDEEEFAGTPPDSQPANPAAEDLSSVRGQPLGFDEPKA